MDVESSQDNPKKALEELWRPEAAMSTPYKLAEHIQFDEELSSVSSGLPECAGGDDILPELDVFEVPEDQDFLMESILESAIPDDVWDMEKTFIEEEVFDVSFDDVELEEQVEEDGDGSIAEEAVSEENETEANLIGGEKCIIFLSQLEPLVKETFRNCSKCGAVTEILHQKCGTAVRFIWKCTAVKSHHGSWSTQPTYSNIFAGNLQMGASLLFSGGSWTKTAMLFKFLNCNFITSRFFYSLQKKYLHQVILAKWKAMQAELFSKAKAVPNVILSGDGRNDSPGHSASYCTYSLLEESLHAIVTCQFVDIREEAKRYSNNMEKIGFVKAMTDVQSHDVKVEELVTDAHPQVKALMKHDPKYEGITHQIDIWHSAKNLAKKWVKASAGKGCRDIAAWIPSIRNHFWHCAQHCNGSLAKLKESWTKVMHHVCNIHEWVDTSGLTNGKCDHGPLGEADRNKPWIKQNSPAHQALKEIVFNKAFLQNLVYHTQFRHTGDLESFHSHLLMYCPKRCYYQKVGYESRNLLAVIDFNFHKDREYRKDANGEVTKQDLSPLYSKVPMAPDDPMQIAPYIAQVPKPS